MEDAGLSIHLRPNGNKQFIVNAAPPRMVTLAYVIEYTPFHSHKYKQTGRQIPPQQIQDNDWQQRLYNLRMKLIMV